MKRHPLGLAACRMEIQQRRPFAANGELSFLAGDGGEGGRWFGHAEIFSRKGAEARRGRSIRKPIMGVLRAFQNGYRSSAARVAQRKLRCALGGRTYLFRNI